MKFLLHQLHTYATVTTQLSSMIVPLKYDVKWPIFNSKLHLKASKL